MLERDDVNILAVEDEKEAKAIIDRILSTELDAEMVMVETVTEAIARLESSSFDVVLLDHNLPGGTGLDVLAEVQEHHEGTPVVYLTGRGDEETARRALSQGAVAYLTKDPDGFDQLAVVVKRAWEEWGGVEPVKDSSRARREDAMFDAGPFQGLVEETDLEGVLVFDQEGRLLESTLPDPLDAEAIAVRAAAWKHHTGKLARSADQEEQRSWGVIHGSGRLAVVTTSPGGINVVGVFPLHVEPASAMQTVYEGIVRTRNEGGA